MLNFTGCCSWCEPCAVLITRGIEKTTKALVAELKLMSKEVIVFLFVVLCISV